MPVELRLPKLGVEMETARLNEWLVEEGDPVAQGDVVATVETEKVMYEMEAPAAGVIHLVGEVDVDYGIGDLLAAVAESQEAYEALAAGGGTAASVAGAEGESAVATASPPAVTNGARAGGASVPAGPEESRDDTARRRRGGVPLASPIARRMAEQHGLALDGISCSGRRGVIKRRDVEEALRDREAAPAAVPGPEHAPPASQPEPVAAGSGDLSGTTTKMSSMRRTIATRMHQSMQQTAQMTDVREHDVTALVELRTRIAAKADTLGYKLSYTDLMTKVAALAVRAVPVFNSRLDGDELTTFDDVNIAMAVAIPDGLVVPVIRGADTLSLHELHDRLTCLVERARERKSTSEEMSGATFTVTNFGAYGSHFGTPILMPGQVGILGVGAMIDRPVVRDGGVVPGKAMFTSVTVDHRVIDGESVGRYQNVVAELLADPERLVYA